MTSRTNTASKPPLIGLLQKNPIFIIVKTQGQNGSFFHQLQPFIKFHVQFQKPYLFHDRCHSNSLSFCMAVT